MSLAAPIPRFTKVATPCVAATEAEPIRAPPEEMVAVTVAPLAPLVVTVLP